jgi:GT2 family glycosyltransferase
MEDLDLCYRFSTAGWTTCYAPRAGRRRLWGQRGARR